MSVPETVVKTLSRAIRRRFLTGLSFPDGHGGYRRLRSVLSRVGVQQPTATAGHPASAGQPLMKRSLRSSGL